MLSKDYNIHFLDKKQQAIITFKEMKERSSFSPETWYRLIPETDTLQEVELFPPQQLYLRLSRSRILCKIYFKNSNHQPFKYHYSPAREGCPTFGQ